MAIKLGLEDIKLYYGETAIDNIYIGEEEVWSGDTPTPTPTGYTGQYLTFDILTAGTIVVTNYNETDISYSLDSGSTWTPITATSTTFSVSVADKVMWKGENDAFIDSFSNSSTAYFNVEGNIMSLLYGDNFATATTFADETTSNLGGLFMYTNVVSAENLVLPATALTEGCYTSMFEGCTSLTTAPELPATTLADMCYQSMFYGCTSLTTAPELPVTTLADYCYSGMFGYCSILETAPELPATTLANYCYENMFGYCSILETAPVLSATTLVDYCYNNMFDGCISLTAVTCLATDISAEGCTSNWFGSLEGTTVTFTKAASMEDWTCGSDGIIEGWTVENDDGTEATSPCGGGVQCFDISTDDDLECLGDNCEYGNDKVFSVFIYASQDASAYIPDSSTAWEFTSNSDSEHQIRIWCEYDSENDVVTWHKGDFYEGSEQWSEEMTFSDESEPESGVYGEQINFVDYLDDAGGGEEYFTCSANLSTAPCNCIFCINTATPPEEEEEI